VYITMHTMVLFFHAVAFNVALNSHNNILITLLISNNFVELKTNVFKKCEKENLFQVSCADVVERFQLSVYILIVTLQFIFVQKVREIEEKRARAAAAQPRLSGVRCARCMRLGDAPVARRPPPPLALSPRATRR